MSVAGSVSTGYAGPPAVPGYVLDEFLGRGASGMVWAATGVTSQDRVAVKVIAAEPGAHGAGAPPRAGGEAGGLLAAAQRERALTGRVSTEHVVRVHDVVALEDGRVGLVMDLADGGSLREVVTMRSALPLGEVVTIATPLASALAQLHEAGVVHADVAPGNVLFTPDGRPMLADLSSARLAEDPWPRVVVGTEGFTAPEVAAGQPPTPESDVWSLGALVWYACSGGMSPPSWVGSLHWPEAVDEDTDPGAGTVADVVATVGPELQPVLVRMLADEPRARPGAAEAAAAIYRVAAPEPVRLVGRHPDPAAAVTIRIRREAAETMTRTQLRQAARAQARQSVRERLAQRSRRMLRPWDRPRPSVAEGDDGVARAPSPRGTTRLGTPRRRLSLVALVAAVLAGVAAAGIGVPLVTGADLAGAPWPAEGPGRASPAAAPGGPAAPGASVPAPESPTAAPESANNAPESANNAPESPTAAPESATAAPGSAAADPAHDPVAALQQLADLRARALTAADTGVLALAELEGSGAYAADARVIGRLREQRQRYAGVGFAVRSAEVECATADEVVVRAVVDRSAYTVLGEDGSAQSFPAAAGAALRYTLSRAGPRWQLTEVTGT